MRAVHLAGGARVRERGGERGAGRVLVESEHTTPVRHSKQGAAAPRPPQWLQGEDTDRMPHVLALFTGGSPAARAGKWPAATSPAVARGAS